MNQNKYLKDGLEENPPVTENNEGGEEVTKEVEPDAPTLEEYYKSKGVDIQNTETGPKQPKKGEVNAEWIKKEKLTVL